MFHTDNEGKTPLHWTAQNESSKTCTSLIRSFPDCLNLKDADQRTAVHLAVAQNNMVVVNALIDFEHCDVSVRDNMNRTPLHWAAVLGSVNIVQTLLARGADHAAADSNGATALHYAVC